ncbi:MAG: manganese efflux pump MntP family protein [Thermoflexaceae bacterium]|nr:manganese efflux pump MntP family protein [Thermoflexaceae bacterium]
MNLVTMLLLAVALSMDAFAVAICKGLAMKKITVGKCVTVGLWFGGFQGLMPFIGYLLANSFAGFIESVSAWIAFILLVLIGGNMVKESFSKEEEEENDSLKFKEMLILAIATSIDAMAVGITFACVPVELMANMTPFLNTVLGCVLIAVTTCILSMGGVKVGSIFGTKYKNKAELAGGVVLVLIGIKILLEHFGVL